MKSNVKGRFVITFQSLKPIDKEEFKESFQETLEAIKEGISIKDGDTLFGNVVGEYEFTT